MGSPGLKESFQAHLSDVLNDIPADKDDSNRPITEVCDQADKDATEANGTPVEGNIAFGVPIVGEDKIVPPLSPSSVTLAVEDSQDSILDIEGATDDEEVSLIGWN